MSRLFFLLGDPVSHSRSPAIHARAFELLGLDARYLAAQVSARNLPTAVSGLRALGVSGFNITVPHKTAVLALVDELSPEASRIGAVNCVQREGEGWIGHNTDAPGLLRALGAAGTEVAGLAACLVGAGGSARAAALAVAPALSALAILNRSAGPAETVARAVFDSTDGRLRPQALALGSAQGEAALARADLVLHCTTVGMGDAQLPFDPASLGPKACVVDFVYAGAPGLPLGETSLLQQSRARGLRCVDGLSILVHQAVASLEIWLGREDLSDLFPELLAAALSARPFPEQTGSGRAAPATEASRGGRR